MKILCANCGRDKVQTLKWVEVNTGKIIDDGPSEIEDNWCPDCENHVGFVTDYEFLENKL